MTDQLKEIGQRLKALREIIDLDISEMAGRCACTCEELESYERGERDFSFSFLYNAAEALGVDVVDLMSGDSPKLSSCCLVRGGEGLKIDRRAAYSYRHLAFTFKGKLAEPFMVTVEPKDIDTPVLHAHDGQEFNYLVEGSLGFYLGEQVYTLTPGDSIYFNSGIPHAMKALEGKPAKFLAIVLKPSGGHEHGAI